MNYAKLGGIFLCAFTLAMQAQAADLCSRLPGIWFGTYTFKKVSDCRKAGACTFMLTSEIKLVSGTTYQVELSPPVYQHKMVNINCINGQITIPSYPDNTITLSYQDNGMYRVTYDDERLSAVISNISN